MIIKLKAPSFFQWKFWMISQVLQNLTESCAWLTDKNSTWLNFHYSLIWNNMYTDVSWSGFFGYSFFVLILVYLIKGRARRWHDGRMTNLVNLCRKL
jgi:hypothetical protein